MNEKENTSKRKCKEKYSDKELLIIAEMSITKLHLIRQAFTYARELS